MKEKPSNQRDVILQVLFFINAAFWIVSSGLSLVRLGSGNTFSWIMSFLMVCNGLIFLYFGMTIHNARRLKVILVLCFLFINIFLTITDQFGIFDLLTLIVNMVIFLVLGMQWLKPKEKASNSET